MDEIRWCPCPRGNGVVETCRALRRPGEVCEGEACVVCVWEVVVTARLGLSTGPRLLIGGRSNKKPPSLRGAHSRPSFLRRLPT